MLYEQKHTGNQIKTKMNQSASNKMTFQKLPGPNGTVITMVSGKAGRETNPNHPQAFTQPFDNLANIVDCWSDLGAHWILKGVPKSTHL